MWRWKPWKAAEEGEGSVCRNGKQVGGDGGWRWCWATRSRFTSRGRVEFEGGLGLQHYLAVFVRGKSKRHWKSKKGKTHGRLKHFISCHVVFWLWSLKKPVPKREKEMPAKTSQELRMLSQSLFIQGSLLFSIVRNVISVSSAKSQVTSL